MQAGFLGLGFGCAYLHGGRRKAEAMRLLQAAYDAGVRYFDVARLYATGEAEGVLGEFMQGRRDEFLVTTKAGILPPKGLLANRLQRKAAAIAGKLLPIPMPPAVEPRFGMFGLDDLKASFAQSLEQLRTGRVDALLLHEADLPDLADGRVLSWLKDLKAEGKIGAYGLASTRDQTERIVTALGERFPVLQYAHVPGPRPAELQGAELTVTHSVLAGRLERVTKKAAGDAAFRDHWRASTAVDPADRQAVAALLLQEAIEANPGGIVLFSSTSPERIFEAARIARERPHRPDQIAGVREMAAAFA